MSSFCPSMLAFAEMIPLSKASYSTTFLRSNMCHVVSETRRSTFNPNVVQRRIVKLSFATIFGRHCFTVGSSRSCDYLLPESNEVAPHHFIVFFDLQERQLYIRNTSSQGLQIVLAPGGNCIKTSNAPVRLTSPMQIRIGECSQLSFELVIPMITDQSLFNSTLDLYVDSLQPPTSRSFSLAECDAKKRQRTRDAEGEPLEKRQCTRLPSVYPTHRVLQNSRAGLLARAFSYFMQFGRFLAMPLNARYGSLLADVDSCIKRNRGTHFEAEIFSHLSCCPFVLRSYEFAIADGALYATPNSEPPTGSYTERFWQLDEQVRMFRNTSKHWSRVLVPFDIKSSVSNRPEDQRYITTVRQRARVGFYVAVCATNPEYVEIIPNRFSGEIIADTNTRKVAVNLTRKSFLPPSAYGYLSPCNSPYRMPISLLPKAIESIKNCAQGLGDYINPWTGVKSLNWVPCVEQGNECLAPTEDSQHFSSFKGVLEIWRAIRTSSVCMEFQFVNLQPRLADFKLLVPDTLAGLSRRRQVFVQYKIDALYRSPASPLNKVGIARNVRHNQLRHYFTEHERFDFLLYQFDYTDQKTSWKQCFFLPEWRIPDKFYTTDAKEGDFSRPEFEPYWLRMDPDGYWVQRVYEIIQQNPQPRQTGGRPHRETKKATNPFKSESIHEIASSPNHVQGFHRKLFFTIMAQCAARRSGLIIVLSRSSSLADFAFCRYTWTTEQQRRFAEDQQVPCTISELPRHTSVIPLLVYSKTRESTSRGPSITATEFERLDASSSHRILIFDLFGSEGRNMYSPLLAVPSNDLSPTQEQRNLFYSNKGKHKNEEFEERVPLLAELLHSGHTPMDYVLSSKGPLLFEPELNPWGELWQLLDQILGLDSFSHPPAHKRCTTSYRVSIQEIHQGLADKHASIDLKPIFLDPRDHSTRHMHHQPLGFLNRYDLDCKYDQGVDNEDTEDHGDHDGYYAY
ncbi:hypothetical protein COCHEDRAFT_1201645 [Bipolaris maydis C5]|uniref:FHA domain-containing protein n=2 Tax=Cochliobolus heterostrophus TaxID=5016 RepID=M2TCJ5_COCH5|nr:hypothetical protein COCHEDRAFT_1201645 [Bipolaris maydis C5]KAJ5021873.1 hypothetical protein J3E73DRAFT_219729 [Bipolaris maydis]KAJ6275453.1 hypothetical protein PSV08DRAFT_406344 [Bipolaris maydis]